MNEFEPTDRDPSEEDESDLKPTAGNAVISSADWTADTIVTQMRRGNIQLTPRFQRREAWTDQRKSRFIESLILGLPVPEIVLAESLGQRGQYIVIDGKQRLIALRRFAVADDNDSGFEQLRLTGLVVRHDLNGKTFADISEDPKFARDVTAFENQPIRSVVLRTWPDESYLYTVFLRLNTGSVPLSPQELRQALHPGPFLDFAESYAADSAALQSALHIDRPDFRMRDVEILVRFFAFSEFLPTYNGNLKSFLDKTCADLNKAWDSREPQLRSTAGTCDAAISATMRIFGSDHAFARWNGRVYESRFNRAVFDVMTFYFKHPTIARASISQRAKVRARFERLCTADAEFTESIQTTTKTVEATYIRLKKWGDALVGVIDAKVSRPRLVNKRIQV